MELNLRFYKCRANAMVVLSLICILGISNSIFSQSKIFVDSEPIQVFSSKIPKKTDQSGMVYQKSWSNVGDAIIPNEVSATLDFESVKFSKTLKFSNFNFNIPLGAKVNGIELILYTDVQGEGFVFDESIYLTDENGMNASINKVGKYYPSKALETDTSMQIKAMVYGFNSDNWGKNWTHDEINSESFGAAIQFRSLTEDPVSILIDHVELNVYYTPLKKVCDGGCAVFSIDEQENENYEWIIPQGFELLSSTVFDDVINLHPSYASYGLYEICVKTYNNQGVSTTCRDFIFQNCRDLARVGGVAFEDQNFNGEKDPGEKIYPNLGVYLYDNADNLVDIAITDLDGYYQFNDILSGKYYVKFDFPTDRLPTKRNQTLNENSNYLNLSGKTGQLYLTQGYEYLYINGGFVGNGSIGDFVWLDENRNGFQDQGEKGIEGVEIIIYTASGIAIDTTYSNSSASNPNYAFENIYPGSYYLKFPELDSFIFTDYIAVDNELNSDVNEGNGTGSTYTFSLSHLENVKDIDAGYVIAGGTIAGKVVFDNNANDVLDVNDSQIESFIISLFNSNGDFIEERLTDSEGNYSFYPIYEGEYYIQFDTIPGFVFSNPFSGNDELVDFDVTYGNGFRTTNSINIIPGETYSGVNAGLVDGRGSISGLAWLDKNGNGIQEDSEPLLNNLLIEIYGPSGLISTTSTDENGSYTFDSLIPNAYYISFDLPSVALRVTLPNVGNDVSVDSDITGTNGDLSTSFIFVNLFDNIIDINGGFTGNGSITSSVFFDENENGLLDNAENGVEGISVTLLDAIGTIINSKLTDASGEVQFMNVPAGEYQIEVTKNENYLFTNSNVGANESLDSDIINITGDTGSTAAFTVFVNEETTNIDAGLILAGGSVTGNVLNDINLSNTIDNGDSPSFGTLIEIYNNNNVLVSSAIADADGNFEFYPILEGNYYLQFETIEGFIFSKANFSGNDSQDFKTDATGKTQVFTVVNQMTNANLNAGYQDARGSISGIAWLDANGNGILDDTEGGIADILITLYNESGMAVNNTMTNQTGGYVFKEIIPSTYYLQFGDSNQDLFFTNSNVGNDDSIDSEVTEVNGSGSTNNILINNFEVLNNYNAGYSGNGSITSSVFFDENENGLLDNAENGVEGISVALLDAIGTIINSELTDASGEVQFMNIPAGEYQIEVTKNKNYLFTNSNVGGDENLDSDIINITGDTGSTAAFTVFVNEETTNVDAGLILAGGSVTGNVLNDINLSNTIDNGDSPSFGTLIEIYNNNNVLVSSAIADADGNFEFYPILEGNYYLQFETIEGFIFSEANFSGIDSQDFKTDATGKTQVFTVVNQMTNANLNAGYQDARGSISGLVWFDENGTAVLENFEKGIENVSVKLVLASDHSVISETQTDIAGNYNFSNIIPQNYYLRFENIGDDVFFTMPNIGNDETKDSEVTGTFGYGSTGTIELQNFVDLSNVNAGVTGNGSIINKIFIDENGNGIKDNNESGVANVVVNLYRNGTIVASMMSTADGSFAFENILVGEYQLEFLSNTLYTFTIPNVGNDDAIDSDVIDFINNFGKTDFFNVVFNEVNDNVTAGFILATGSINGTVVFDSNANNILDNLVDIVIQNSQVQLYNDAGVLIQTKTTNNNGFYSFSQVPIGEYYIVFESIEGFTFSAPYQSSNQNLDFDVDESNGERSTKIFLLNNGDIISGVNAGYIDSRSNISGVAFLDNNNTSLYDNEDDVLEGITIQLVNSNTSQIYQQTISAVDGTYQFNDIVPGDYYLAFLDYDDDLIFVIPNAGDDTIDSDITDQNGIGTTDILSIVLNENILNIDAGFIGFGSIANIVFLDINENGIKDNNESGVEGVQIELLDINNMTVNSFTTSIDGAFEFLQVLQGNYILKFNISNEYKFTFPNVGNDENVDSDALVISPSMANTSQFLVGRNAIINNVTAGLVLSKGSVNGYIVEDLNRNNLLDAPDNQLSSLPVLLFDAQNTLISTTTTNDIGYFEFVNINVGDYYIVYPEIEGFVFSTPNIGTDDSIDFDVTSAFGLGSTDLFTIIENQTVSDVNAGYIDARGAIQGMVWVDKNANGLKESDEDFVSNKIVKLVDDQNNTISTTTDELGNYQFSNLLFKDYYVIFEVLELEQYFTIADIGNDETIDSDVTESNGVNSTDLISIVEFSQVAGVNAGVTGYGSISNQVFLDENGNSIFDNSETGVEDILVELYKENGEFVNSTSTDLNGDFQFSSIPPGFYFMQFTKNNSYNFVLADQGNDDLLDSDVIASNGNNGVTNSFFVFYNEDNMNVTAGLSLSTGSITGNVVLDINNDNQLGIDDDPIANHPIKLINVMDMTVLTTFSDTIGSYIFNNLVPGDYYVVFDTIENLNFSLPNVGGNELLDFDVENTFGKGSTNVILVDPGSQINGVNAGFTVPLGSIMGTVWNDCNGDGLFKDGEMGVDSFKVILLDTLGMVVDSTLTDTLGMYVFEDLEVGHYQVFFELLDTTAIFSPSFVGMDMLIDSDIVDSLGRGYTDTLFISIDTHIKGVNAGIPGKGSVSNIVFNDLNENGLFDMGDMPLPGVEVSLIDYNDEVVISQMTDDTGLFNFENVFAGDYVLKFKKPLFYIFSEANVGPNDSIDSDVVLIDGLFGYTDTFNLKTDSLVNNLTAGLFFMTPMTSKIEGNIWDDTNPDGIRLMDEGPLENIIVMLFNESGSELASTQSDINGHYEFNDLIEGFYYLKVKLSNGRTVTKSLSDTPSDTTSIFNNNNGKGTTSTFYLGIQDTLTNYNAGIANELMLIGIVWDDLNADGIRDDSEPYFPNVLVTVTDENGINVESKITGVTGNYIFNGLTAGVYELSIDLPEGYVCTRYQVGQPNTDNDFFVNGKTGLIDYPASVTTGIDAGLVKPGSIGDFVWADFNGNGAQQGNEPGIDNVVVKLFNSDNVEVATTMTITDNNGKKGFYKFDNIQPNDYYIKVIPPTNYIFTIPGVFAPLFDSNITEANGEGTSDIFVLGYEEEKTDIDVGMYIPGSIGDRVWLDENGNGLQDIGEPGIEGVTVELFKSNGTSQGTVVTDANGEYMFMELAQGLYYISLESNSGYTYTIMDASNNDAIDSDVNPNGVSPLINLAFSVMYMDLDVGILPPGFIPDGENELTQENQNQEISTKVFNPIKVYPNPAVDFVKIENTEPNTFIYYVHDEKGNTMMKSTIAPGEIQSFGLEQFGPGVYYVKINYNNRSYSRSIIVIK